ncbi:hypothetical protein T09_200 [Trichinella sp. T9]|nr:hypothetical protein T09_200 [Trichinella sp. T9]
MKCHVRRLEGWDLRRTTVIWKRANALWWTERSALRRHYIETEVVQPVKLPPRTLPLAQREVMDRLMREMLQAGVIEPAAGT